MKKTINYLIISILVIIPLIINPFAADYFYKPKIKLIYLIVAFMCILWFLGRESNKINLIKEEKLILIYASLLIISTFFSENIIISLYGNIEREEGLFALLAYILLFILAYRFYKFSDKQIIFLGISSFLASTYGILQHFKLDPIPRDEYRQAWETSSFSTIGNPNFLGSYLVLFLPIFFFIFIYTSKLIYLMLSLVIYSSLLLSFTRGAWLGGLLAFAVMIFLIIKYKLSIKNLLILSLGLTIVTLILNNISNGAILGRFFTIGKDFTSLIEQQLEHEAAGSNRIFIWNRVIKLINERPLFGYGIESLGNVFGQNYVFDIYNFYDQYVIIDRAHNEYLHIAVSTGLPSLIIYLIFIYNIIIKAIKGIKKDIFLIPLLCSVIGYLAQAFFNISVVSVAYIFWILLGIVLNRIYKDEGGGLYE